MTNSQNPLGVTLSPEKKARLVEILDRHNVMLIEDDVYSELYFGREKPLPAKAWIGATRCCTARHSQNVWCRVFASVG